MSVPVIAHYGIEPKSFLSFLCIRYMAYIMDTNEEERVKVCFLYITKYSEFVHAFTPFS